MFALQGPSKAKVPAWHAVASCSAAHPLHCSSQLAQDPQADSTQDSDASGDRVVGRAPLTRHHSSQSAQLGTHAAESLFSVSCGNPGQLLLNSPSLGEAITEGGVGEVLL